jgi:hypothetical protein
MGLHLGRGMVWVAQGPNNRALPMHEVARRWKAAGFGAPHIQQRRNKERSIVQSLHLERVRRIRPSRRIVQDGAGKPPGNDFSPSLVLAAPEHSVIQKPSSNPRLARKTASHSRKPKKLFGHSSHCKYTFAFWGAAPFPPRASVLSRIIQDGLLARRFGAWSSSSSDSQ